MAGNFDDFLRGHFPEAEDATVIRMVSEGVGLADDLRRGTLWLSTELGADLTGMLRRVAAMWRIRKACLDGDLPFAASEVSNLTGSSHLLSIRSGPFEAHVVRTDTPGGFPKEAPIRQDKALRNQGDLLSEPRIVPLGPLLRGVRAAYAWLSFNALGAGQLTHVCWCMPEADGNRYLSRFEILRIAQSRGTISAAPVEPPSKPDPTQKMKFKRDIEEQIEQNRKQDKKD